MILLNIKELEMALEAILFTSGKPVSINKIAISLGQDIKITKKIVSALIHSYDEQQRGIQIIQINDKYQMCTRSNYYEYIKKLIKVPQKQNLTEVQIETLAIIAYKQPITKPQIESIRGVRCDRAVNSLIDCDLICEKGRMKAPGRPIMFGTTDVFLRCFGIKNIKNLPEVSEEALNKIQLEVEDEVEEEIEEEIKFNNV